MIVARTNNGGDVANWYDDVKKNAMKGGTKGSPDVSVEADDIGPVVTVRTYLSLVQVFGYLKYRSGSRVLIRGQTSCYGNLKPTALRHHPPRVVEAEIEDFLGLLRRDIEFDDRPEYQPSTEPVLQHYGFNTRWLDVVDSLPHALYFALHRLARSGAHLKEEDPKDGLKRDWGYLYLIDCSHDSSWRPVTVVAAGGLVIPCNGVWRTHDGFMVCDLRIAKPSKALRPHAQHGLLCRPSDDRPDLWDDRLMLRLRVPRASAVNWISGEATAYSTMFPPRDLDRYYHQLLSENVGNTIKIWKRLGTRAYEPGFVSRYHNE